MSILYELHCLTTLELLGVFWLFFSGLAIMSSLLWGWYHYRNGFLDWLLHTGPHLTIEHDPETGVQTPGATLDPESKEKRLAR